MSLKNHKLLYRVALVMLGLLSIIVLTRSMSLMGWKRTIGNSCLIAAPPWSGGARIEIDATQRVGPVNKLLFGSYVIAPGGGSAIVDTDSQFSADALQMIQELQPSILRLGDLPIFEDSIGDPHTRPAARCGWEWWHTYEYGVDEHMALLEAIGAEDQALITVGYPDALVDSSDPDSCIISSIDSNLSQMVKRAMAWVAYVNGDPADATLIGLDDQGFDWRTVGYWAQRRADNGHPEPYSVKYWEIGNEIYFHPDEISPEKYGQDYIAFRDAMKQVDPSIVVGASAALVPSRSSAWNSPLLSGWGISPRKGPLLLAVSPAGGSTLMTSAPRSARSLAQKGPEMKSVYSRTFRSDSASPVMGYLPQLSTFTVPGFLAFKSLVNRYRPELLFSITQIP